MPIRAGVRPDDGVSSFLKCHITQVVDGVTLTVVGYLTESCEMALNSIWNSPFGEDSISSVGHMAKTADITQTLSESTAKAAWNSEQVWEGIEPPEVTFQLKFVAYTDAYNEVDKAIMYLMRMASPELNELTPVEDLREAWANKDLASALGRIPSEAMFNFGRIRNMPMRISNISFDVNAPKTPSGNFAYNTVSVTAAPKRAYNRSEIPSIFS